MNVLLDLWRKSALVESIEEIREPFLYRSWKWAWQKIPHSLKEPSLFNKISKTNWDLLIILDACRYDSFCSVIEWGVPERVQSPASSTPEFLMSANEEDLFANTTYVSANPQTELHPLNNVEHVPLFNTSWKERLATVPIEDVLEEATSRVRNEETTVAHTLQPHFPHICKIAGETIPVPGGFHPAEEPSMKGVTQPQIYLTNTPYPLQRFRDSYHICLKYAWKEIMDVVNQLISEGYAIAITSDHGELFGEYGFVEHPTGVPIPQLYNVPWILFKPPNSDTYKRTELEGKLNALGYL